MVSTLDIWNMALGLVGGELLISKNEESPAAELCKLHYETSLFSVLEGGDWNFAVKRIELPLSLDMVPAFTYTASHALPSDCLRVIEVWKDKSGGTNSRYETNELQWEQEGDYISSDIQNSIYVKYISSAVTPDVFSGSFVNSLSTYLAYKLAVPLSDNRSLKLDLLNEYKLMVQEAINNNGMTGRTKVLRSNVLISSRTQ